MMEGEVGITKYLDELQARYRNHMSADQMFLRALKRYVNVLEKHMGLKPRTVRRVNRALDSVALIDEMQQFNQAFKDLRRRNRRQYLDCLRHPENYVVTMREGKPFVQKKQEGEA